MGRAGATAQSYKVRVLMMAVFLLGSTRFRKSLPCIVSLLLPPRPSAGTNISTVRRRVYVLGSGFSRAINSLMPTLSSLSCSVKSSLGGKGLPGADTPISNNFEDWLNFLSQASPWLERPRQFEAKAAFELLTMALYEQLKAAQIRTSVRPLPPWLTQLVSYWDRTDATVLTFNYDVLVEAAWLACASGPRTTSELYPVPLTPAALRVGGTWGTSTAGAGLRLLKLHGSLSWWYSGPDSPPGDTVYDLGVLRPESLDDGVYFRLRDDERLVVDKLPMIVPPTMTKGSYYINRVLTSLWSQAAESLRSAEELVVMGFSMPSTDHIVGSLMATELAPNACVIPLDCDVSVVNRFRRLLGEAEGDSEDRSSSETSRVLETWAGSDDPIEQWVQQNTS